MFAARSSDVANSGHSEGTRAHRLSPHHKPRPPAPSPAPQNPYALISNPTAAARCALALINRRVDAADAGAEASVRRVGRRRGRHLRRHHRRASGVYPPPPPPHASRAHRLPAAPTHIAAAPALSPRPPVACTYARCRSPPLPPRRSRLPAPPSHRAAALLPPRKHPAAHLERGGPAGGRVVKETEWGWTDARTDARTDTRTQGGSSGGGTPENGGAGGAAPCEPARE
jgi:hypothetical protein